MSDPLDVNRDEFWDAAYAGDRAGWDLGGPTPVFANLAASGQIKPGRMTVICAGRGHDARLFARHGLQVTAIDFSAEAVADMERLADPAAPVRILHADLFHLPPELDGASDYVLEYTCMCAIDPTRRSEFADVVTRLLRPGGLYITLAFPLDNRPGGPPFSVSVPEIMRLFGERGFKLLQRGRTPDSVKPRRGLEELLLFEKA